MDLNQSEVGQRDKVDGVLGGFIFAFIFGFFAEVEIQK